MCQPRSEGGRRCPIHRHDSVAYLQVASSLSNLTKNQVENIFRELSREGRNSDMPSPAVWKNELLNLQATLNKNMTNYSLIKDNLTKALDNFTVPDGKTYYAIQKIQEISIDKANQLNNLLSYISTKKMMNIDLVKEKFNEYYQNVDLSRKASLPKEYSQQAYLFAKNNNLPYDKASVITIEQLRNIKVEQENAPRVKHNKFNNQSPLFSIGYNIEGGRLEVALKGIDNINYYAYQGIPESVYKDIFKNGIPIISKIQEIRRNPDYKYKNEIDKERDKYNIRCNSCGQFASPLNHNCPSYSIEQDNILNLNDIVDFSVNPKTKVIVNEKDGIPNYSFVNNPIPSAPSGVKAWVRDNLFHYVTSLEINKEEFTEFQTYVRARQLRAAGRFIEDFNSIENFKEIGLSLLDKGSVTLPVQFQYTENRRNLVTGNITYNKDTSGRINVLNSDLECTCPVYRRNQECSHSLNTNLIGSLVFKANNRYNATEQNFSKNSVNNILENSRTSNPLFVFMYRSFLQNPDLQNNEEELTRLGLKTQEEELAIIAERTRTEAAEQAEHRAHVLRMRERRIKEMGMNYEEILASRVDTWKNENPERATQLQKQRVNLINKWQSVEPSYKENPELANQAIQDALKRKKNGAAPIIFRPEGVLDGSSDGISGRKFGIELEFDLPENVNKKQVIKKIAQELFEANLIPEAKQDEYHAAAKKGYKTWSFEEDETVHAELVSPILDDSPESWEQVRIATEIITRNGGKATTRAGSHVHVSTGSYENSSAKRAELLRFNREHQDMVYRLASDPSRGKHRGWSWCAPNIDDNAGDIDESIQKSTKLFKGEHDSHDVGINFGSAKTDLTSSNVEYRMWDATLDAGAIQAQVMLSVAMTDYAERTVLTTKKSLARESVLDIGTAASNNIDRLDISGDTGFSEFVDKLFRKNEDKEQIASLFAITNWQK